MQLTPEQVKGRIKNVAKENKADARTLGWCSIAVHDGYRYEY